MLTYHDAPPFIVDDQTQTGLTYDLAQWLAKQSGGRFRFSVQIVPKKRLEALLGLPKPVVVPWVNPKWFETVRIQNQFWTSPYLNDSNALVSLAGNPVEYEGPKSLIGKSVAGLYGGRWPHLEKLMAEGKIYRVDAPSYQLALKMVLAARADVAIVPTPIAKYYAGREGSAGYFYLSKQPESLYSRHLLVTERRDVYRFIEAQIPHLLGDPAWRTAIDGYGF